MQDFAAANDRLEAARRAVLGFTSRGASSQGGTGRPHSAKAGYAGGASSLQRHARQLSDDGGGSGSNGAGECARACRQTWAGKL